MGVVKKISYVYLTLSEKNLENLSMQKLKELLFAKHAFDEHVISEEISEKTNLKHFHVLLNVVVFSTKAYHILMWTLKVERCIFI